jgi:UTP:GlnB (protein PII) uridylyltransferase
MATSSKQYKAIGEDLWKGRTEKIVRCLFSSAVLILTRRTLKERGAVRDDVRRARRAAHTGLRGLRRS